MFQGFRWFRVLGVFGVQGFRASGVLGVLSVRYEAQVLNRKTTPTSKGI